MFPSAWVVPSFSAWVVPLLGLHRPSSSAVEAMWRLPLCATYAALLLEIWVHRKLLFETPSKALLTALNMLGKGARASAVSSGPSPFTTRLSEMRIKSMRRCLLVAKYILLVFSAVGVLSIEQQGFTADNYEFRVRMAVGTLIYVILSYAAWHPHQDRYINRYLAVASVISSLNIVQGALRPSPEHFMTTLLVPLSLRFFFSVLCLNWRMASSLHFIHALAQCCQVSRLDPSLFPFLSRHGWVGILFSWLSSSLLYIITEQWFTDMLHNELVASLARHDAEKLLSGLCDSVVRLDSQLRIMKPTPHLLHLLSSMPPANLDAIMGMPFNNIVHESDHDIFDRFISSTALALPQEAEAVTGPVPAIRVNLRDEIGGEVPVELFHVRSLGVDSEPQHLVGLREVRKDGFAPDESLCQRSRAPSAEVAGPFSPKVRQSPSSRSSRTSSASTLTDAVKRSLKGLDKIQLKLDLCDCELGILEYNLCATQCSCSESSLEVAKSLVPFSTCVTSTGDPFYKWLQQSTNTLMNSDGMQSLEYQGFVTFRPPNIACASSKIVLCAESALLSQVDDESFDLFSLELCCISQVTKGNQTRKSEPDGLSIVPEFIGDA